MSSIQTVRICEITTLQASTEQQNMNAREEPVKESMHRNQSQPPSAQTRNASQSRRPKVACDPGWGGQGEQYQSLNYGVKNSCYNEFR